MELFFTPAAQARLSKALNDNTKLILDFDDGVGPFSALGNCSLDTHFTLIAVNADQDYPDFDAKMTSNLGPIWYKSYTSPQFDEHMEVRFNKNFFTMPLVSDRRFLTDNLEFMDLQTQTFQKPIQLAAHDC